MRPLPLRIKKVENLIDLATSLNLSLVLNRFIAPRLSILEAATLDNHR